MPNGLQMPDGRVDRVQPEMYLNYTGVDAFSQNHRDMAQGTLRHLVNGTVRNGWVQTRPHFECLVPDYVDAADQSTFEGGKIQGSAVYSFGSQTVIVYAVDGNLFAFDPDTLKLHNINPEGGRPFSRFADFVYFQTRAGYLVSGDGIGRQVISEGLASRYADPTDPVNEVPTGLMMADDWGRLAIVDPSRRRIRFSNHEMDPDPSYSALAFDETFDYYLNSRFFEVPNHIGRIVWIGFLPVLDTDTGTGPLLVLGEHGARYYDVSIPREQWKTQDISGTLLPNIGGISHRAQVIRNDNLIFSDQYGRIRSLKNARRDEQTNSVKRFDRGVFPYYEHEPKDLRRFRIAAEFNERILVGIQPESAWIHPTGDEAGVSNRYNVRHRGFAVWNGEVTEQFDERDISVWDGLWTGIFPATIDVGRFGGQSSLMCVSLSVDDDGVNRPYRIHEDGAGRHDIADDGLGNMVLKRIEMQLQTRPLDFSARDTDYSLLLKRLNRGVIRIGERYSKTTIAGRIHSDQEYLGRDWFTHETDADHALEFETVDGECKLVSGMPQHDPKLQLPADHAPGSDPVHCTKLQNFYKAALHLVVTGWARLEEIMLDAERIEQRHTHNTVCSNPKVARNVGCEPNLWGYHARTAPELDPCHE